MLDIRYLPGIHIFIFALTLYNSYFIISMSLYLPFIPEHLISTYPINILTHSYKNKHTIPISIYILYYSITISFHHHSIHTPSSTLFIYYLTYLSLSFILSPLIYHSQFYHILFTIYTITILLPHNISFYTFQDKKKKIYLSYILLVYTIYYRIILFYTILLILLHILYLFILLLLLYTSFTYHSTTISNTSLHTQTHRQTHTDTHRQTHSEIQFTLNIEYISITYYLHTSLTL